jgi:hypothetical protein
MMKIYRTKKREHDGPNPKVRAANRQIGEAVYGLGEEERKTVEGEG